MGEVGQCGEGKAAWAVGEVRLGSGGGKAAWAVGEVRLCGQR